jgi:hypothetical protein
VYLEIVGTIADAVRALRIGVLRKGAESAVLAFGDAGLHSPSAGLEVLAIAARLAHFTWLGASE